MNLVQAAPAWLIVIFCLALAVAAVEDVARLRVSNITVLLIIAAAGVAAATIGLSFALWENFLVFVPLLAGGTILFARGKVGGGDVKLLAAAGLWTDLESALILVAAVFISGGLLALALLSWRLVPRKGNVSALRDRAKGIPYAVAIAVGAFVLVAIERWERVEGKPNPLEFPPDAAGANEILQPRA